MNISNITVIKNKILSKILMIFGVIWALFGICAMLGGDDDYVFIIVIFVGLGAWAIYVGYRKKKMIEIFQHYVQVISCDPTGSIENLSASVGTSQDVAKKNLEVLIKKKYFTNAHINNDTNCIIIGTGMQQDNSLTVNQQHKIDNNTNVEYITVTCKNCGGINKIIKGKVCECDFCGSPIQS